VRDDADGERGVEHLVVEGERLRRGACGLEAQRGQARAGGASQLAGAAGERGGGDAPGPGGRLGPLQPPAGADAGGADGERSGQGRGDGACGAGYGAGYGAAGDGSGGGLRGHRGSPWEVVQRSRSRSSSTSRASACELKVNRCRPGAPASSTWRARSTVKRTPIRRRSALLDAVSRRCRSSRGAATPLIAARRSSRRGLVAGTRPGTIGIRIPASWVRESRPR